MPHIDISAGSKGTQYVALSHCWGKDSSFLKLTLNNQHALRLGVPVTELTRTFQEAINTTASLGYSFIWIDSLCIIQDSPEDWKRESVTMRDIYGNSSLTIVASAAWNGKEGLFRSQDPLSNHPCVLGVRNNYFKDVTVTYAIPSQMDVEKTRRIELELCKWNTRGWCLQERILSHRIVFFSESQLHFELKNDMGELIHLKSQANERDFFEPNRYRPDSSAAKAYSAYTWWDYVNSYTQRQLTYRSDRAPAIRGLASFIEEAGSSMSLSALNLEMSSVGRSSNDFIASLLWFVDKNITSRPSSDTDTYPTWSWLSVDGVVLNDSAGEVYSNSTLSITGLIPPSTASLDATMFAAGIKSLSLIVRGKLRKAVWKLSPSTHYFARRGGVRALCNSPPGYRDEDLYLLYLRGKWHKAKTNPAASIEDYLSSTKDSESKFKGHWHIRSNGRFEYLEMVRPVSSDAKMGPEAHVILSNGEREVGWFVPDTTDPIPEEVYFLQIRVEPETTVEKYKLINTWCVRGLVLTPIIDETHSPSNIERQQEQQDQDYGVQKYLRIGYFELNADHRGFLHTDFAFDWRFTDEKDRRELRYNFLRHWPDIDPCGFFEEVEESEFIIG